MDISINSGKYAKKSDVLELAKAVKELSNVIDYQADALSIYGQFLNDLIASVGNYNELLLRETQEAVRVVLPSKEQDIFTEELRTRKDLLDDQVLGQAEAIRKDFLAKLNETQKRHGLEPTKEEELLSDE